MYRPKSAVALTLQQNGGSDKVLLPPDYQQAYLSPTDRSSGRNSPALTEEEHYKARVYDDYKGAKADVSAYKKVKGHGLWLRHKVVSYMNNALHGQEAIACLLILLVVGMWTLYANMLQKASEVRHLVVLDAGSTGTRVHVFEYSADPRSNYALLRLPEPKLKVEPGLSSYAEHLSGAGASLQPLIAFAQQHVPAQLQQTTPVYLMATAGLRLLPPAAADAILQQCRGALAGSPFLFKPEWASIISGMSEGLYAWVAANYAAGNLQAAARNMRSRKEPRQPRSMFKALIEMGGASAQVTFMPERQWHGGSSKGHESLRLDLPGVNQPLWSHSYLGYGFDVVEQQVQALVKQQALAGTAALTTAPIAVTGQPSTAADAQQQQAPLVQHEQQHMQIASPGTSAVMDPCLPAGYMADDGRTGSGEWQQCQRLVAAAIDPVHCKAAAEAPCPEIPAHMPSLTGQLVATENFAYTARALELPENSSIGDFALAARRFCSRPWPQTLLNHSKDAQQQKYLWRYCFGSAFAWTVLHEVLHLGEGQQLQFTNMLKSTSGLDVGLDWALGAAVIQLSRGARSEQGALLMQQQRVVNVVLVAALVGTATLLAGAMLVAARLGKSREVAKQQAAAAGAGAKSVWGGTGSVWSVNAVSVANSQQAYSPLPVSTRISG